MECADHGLELVDLLAPLPGARVLVVRSEEPDRVVTPVVAQRSLQQAIVLDELVDRHKLHRGHAERKKGFDDCWVSESGIGPAKGFRNFRMASRKALEMRLIDHRLMQRSVRRTIAGP